MRLVRTCGNETLPGGLATWRKLARMAGYKGIIQVLGFGVDGSNAQVAKGYKGVITLGLTMIIMKRFPVKIVIYLNREYAPCARFSLKEAHPLFTLAHELGHAWAARHGKTLKNSRFATYSQWRAMEQENWADRYARRLLRRAGVR